MKTRISPTGSTCWTLPAKLLVVKAPRLEMTSSRRVFYRGPVSENPPPSEGVSPLIVESFGCRRSHRWCGFAGTDLGWWWPSRLEATAAEDRLSFRRNSIPDFWFRLASCHRGVLSRTHNTNWEETLSIQFGRQGGGHIPTWRRAQMRFVSTAFVMMAMALMLLALTLLT
jgi:hypothetical protein